MRKRTEVALIDEARCIGCARCLDACPVDAIIGAQGWMHTVVADWCTGCELCLPPCPVDCIELVAPPAPWTASDARDAKQRHAQRNARLASKASRQELLPPASRKAAVAAALQRAKARRA
jgi:electron transport complex protein RnfB